MTWKKSDSNQQSVVDELRKRFYSVAIISEVGGGVPDLIVGVNGKGGKRNYLIELKNEKAKPSARKLTPDEEKFKDSWKGQYNVCKNLDEILKVINES